MQASFVNKYTNFFNMLYKNSPVIPKWISGEARRTSKQDSNGIGDLYPLQILTAGRAVNKREQLRHAGRSGCFCTSFKPGGVASGKESRAPSPLPAAEGFAAGMVRVAVSAAV